MNDYIFDNRFSKFNTAISFYNVALNLRGSAKSKEDFITVGYHLHQSVEFALKGFLASIDKINYSNNLIKLIHEFKGALFIDSDILDTFSILDQCWNSRHAFNYILDESDLALTFNHVKRFLNGNYVTTEIILSDNQIMDLLDYLEIPMLGSDFEYNIMYAVYSLKNSLHNTLFNEDLAVY